MSMRLAGSERTGRKSYRRAALYAPFCAGKSGNMKRLGRTRPFRGSDGQVVPGSIAEVKYLRLGGLEQWVMTRGESLSNPPLILQAGQTIRDAPVPSFQPAAREGPRSSTGTARQRQVVR
jgi:hypothetical protein